MISWEWINSLLLILDDIKTMLSLRLLAFHALDNLHHDLGPGYNAKNTRDD